MQGRDDVKLMGVGILDFSNDQAAQLRATLLRRAVRQEVAQNVNREVGARMPNKRITPKSEVLEP